MVSTMSWVSAPLTDRPMKHVGAVQRLGQGARAAVSTAWADFHWFMSSVRPR